MSQILSVAWSSRPLLHIYTCSLVTNVVCHDHWSLVVNWWMMRLRKVRHELIGIDAMLNGSLNFIAKILLLKLYKYPTFIYHFRNSAKPFHLAIHSFIWSKMSLLTNCISFHVQLLIIGRVRTHDTISAREGC